MGRPKKNILDKVVENVTNLEEVADKLQEEDFSLEPAEFSEEPVTNPDEPLMGSPEWNNYVLSHFTDNEMVDGRPTVDGLRRVAQKLLGRITGCYTDVIDAASQSNGYRATVTVTITIENRKHHFLTTYCGSADCAPTNTDAPYVLHPTATAETMAEGRALRKMLCLNKIITAEETCDTPAIQEAFSQWSADAKITPEMIIGIDRLASSLNVDVMKYINVGTASFHTIEEVPFGTARTMMEHLNTWRTAQDQIPASIRGYKENWRANK